MWIDIGVNLTNRAFAGDLPEVVARARAQGVGAMVITGTSVAESEQAQQLASQLGQYATAGIHPHDAKLFTDASLERLRTLAARPEVVAIGECGLDYNRDYSPRPSQREAFAQQLELATELGMPVFLHERDAHNDFIAILSEYRQALPAAVLHCFTGTAAELDACLALDLHIGITGWICDERRGLQLRELISRIPAGRLMLETDAPYLLPRDLTPKPRSRRNEPAYLPHIAATVARLRGESLTELAYHCQRTCCDFFAIENPNQ